MNCKHASELMNYSLDADLPPDEAQELYGHISECGACAGAYAELGKLVKEASRCPIAEPPPGFWDDIWRNVRQRAMDGERSWWQRIHLRLRLAAVTALMVMAALLLSTQLGNDRAPKKLAMAEASSRHGIAMMQQPGSDHGLAMLAVSEATVASYNAANKREKN